MKDFIKEELQEVAPFLDEIRKPGHLQLGHLPQDYFEQFEQQLDLRLELEEELEELAPSLLGLPKPKLGELPEDYFVDLEQKIQEKLDLDLEENSFLNQFKQTKQALPADYFDSFEDRLMERITHEATEEKKASAKIVRIKSTSSQKPWWQRSSGVMSIAASFLLLVMAGIWWVRGEFRSPYQRSMAMNVELELRQLQLAEADAYILKNLDELETEELVENLDDDEFEALNQQTASFITVIQDTIPPKPKKEDPKKIKKEDPKKQSSPQIDDFQTEAEEDLLDETDIEDLALDLDDDDFAALEAALLKPKKTSPENNKTQKSNK